MYDDVLTRESEAQLAVLVRKLPHPLAIAGGHAVKYLVEKDWRKRFGESYFGSRDIDIGYLVDSAWGVAELRKSAAGRAPQVAKRLHFEPSGIFRFRRILDENGNPIPEEPRPPKLPGVDYFILYLDLMVTHSHASAKAVLGFTPIDETLLAPAFRDQTMRRRERRFGPGVYIPRTPLMVAMKLSSAPSRTNDDKAIKDLCDLYALVSFGGTPLREINRVLAEVLPEAGRRVDLALGHPRIGEAVDHLGVQELDYRAAIGPLGASAGAASAASPPR